MRLKDCHGFSDFRELARRRLPSPIFNYIDGAADDEITYERNTKSFEDCDLVPNVLRGVEEVDMSVTIMGQKLEMPIYCPTFLLMLSGSPALPKQLTFFETLTLVDFPC